MNERKDAIRDARTLGVPKMLLLGLQHMFAMFGATILVPILVNSYFEVKGIYACVGANRLKMAVFIRKT